MVGKELTRWLVHHDCPVVRLVRRPVKDKLSEIFWDPEKGELDGSKLVGFDAVIHLAGENVASGLWTSKKKQAIMDSRVKSTDLLVKTIESLKEKPKVFISSSGINIYGQNQDEDPPFTEDSPESGKDYLSDVVRKWESASKVLSMVDVRVCHLRFGAILSPTGGLLKKVLPIFKFAAGGRLGNGKQMMSWVSLNDVVKSIWHILNNAEVKGAVNVCSPETVSNKQFTKALAKAVGLPAIFPAPSFIINGIFGEMAENLMLVSIKCAPLKLVSSGFEFEHSDLRICLNDLLDSDVAEVVVTDKKDKDEGKDDKADEAEKK